jgi:hypothetical protein
LVAAIVNLFPFVVFVREGRCCGLIMVLCSCGKLVCGQW